MRLKYSLGLCVACAAWGKPLAPVAQWEHVQEAKRVLQSNREHTDQAVQQAEAQWAELQQTLARLQRRIQAAERHQREAEVAWRKAQAKAEALSRQVAASRQQLVELAHVLTALALRPSWQDGESVVDRRAVVAYWLQRKHAVHAQWVQQQQAWRLQTQAAWAHKAQYDDKQRALVEAQRTHQATQQTQQAALDALRLQQSKEHAIWEQLSQTESELRQRVQSLRRRQAGLAVRPSDMLQPVQGKVSSYRQGVLIQATPGASVRAVAPGQVVFADHFKGLGHLIIIQHPGDWMSLYARYEHALKGVGDQVERSTPVARMGPAGHGSSRHLYFELRHKGKGSRAAPWMSHPASEAHMSR